MIDSELVVCVGSVSYDLIFQVDRLPDAHEKLRCDQARHACGGSAANTAHWLARMGHRVAFAGCVGDDEMGRACTAALRAFGVSTDWMQKTTNATTGVATVFVNQCDKRMVTATGANAFFDPGCFRFDVIGPKTRVHVSLLDDNKAIRMLRESKLRGASTSCEFNGARSAERVEFCDICFMNSDELARWMGPEEPLKRWRDRFGHLDTWLVVTQGEAGAIAIHRDREYRARPPRVEVVDRTGAGDAFDAAFLAGIVRQLQPQLALEMGLQLATEVIRHIGPAPSEIDPETIHRITSWT